MDGKLYKSIEAVPGKDWSVLEKQATVFHSKNYGTYQEKTGTRVWYFLAHEGDCLTGAVPILVKSALFWSYGLVPVEAWVENNNEDMIKEFYRALFDACKKELKWLDGGSNMGRLKVPLDVRKAGYGTYVVDLSKSEEDLWNAIHSKHRNVIRSAEKASLQFDLSTDVKGVGHVVRETLKRAGQDFLSDAHLEVLTQSSLCRLYTVQANGEIQGAAVIPFNQKRAYYLYGGSLRRPVNGAMNFLHWNIMKDLKKEGVGLYDFGGARVEPDKESKIYTIQRFKERFGGTFEQCWIWEKPFSPFLMRLVRLFRHLRSWVKGRLYPGSTLDQEIKRQKL